MNERLTDSDRPKPEAFLRQAAQEGRGRLKVFLGAAPGVGKTYEMLTDGMHRKRAGIDVVVGVVETHGRIETEALTRGHEIIARRDVEYQGRTLAEMDIDAIIARHPDLVLVDELAHSNAPGSRHPKRYQDVDELLAAGIDVYSTINIQHIESLNDVVASFTKVRVRETVPDRVLEVAEIEVVDIPPDELIERLKDGKVYIPDEASRALNHFFSKSNLSALRELALRRAAQSVDAQMLDYVRAHALAGSFAAGERVIVAVSEQPDSPGLIRAAKRLADALRAPWTALHIETPRTSVLGDAERQRLNQSMALAAQLGAATATIPAQSVVDGLSAYAGEARATQIVVGKSSRPWWFELRHGSVVDQLVRNLSDVAVHVLPSDRGVAPAQRSRAHAKGNWGKPGDYILSLLMVAGVTGVGLALGTVLDIANIALLYLLPVMMAASLYGLRAGLFASVASSLAYNFFFLPPTGTLTINNPENVITIVVLLSVALVTSQFAARIRAQADLATSSARLNAALAGFSRQLTTIASDEELMQAICAELARLFDARACVLTPSDDGPQLRAAWPPEDKLDHMERAAAQWAIDKGTPTGRGSDTLTGSDWLFYPMKTARGTLGVIGLARDDGSDPVPSDKISLMLSLTDQAALVLERMQLADEMRDVAQLKERDRLRAALLSSVSHDLRTPLTAIIAAASEMRRGNSSDLIDTVEGEAQRLNRFVANLLDMARVEAGVMRLNIEPTDLTDAIASAVHDTRGALLGHDIQLSVAPGLPLVRVDAQLFHHILINLLDNAGRYADPGTPISVEAVRRPGELVLSLLDTGPGLPPGREEEVFQTFARFEGSDRSKGGTGLGLAIVKGFADAMGLGVTASNRADGPGARFNIRFPEDALVRDFDQEKILLIRAKVLVVDDEPHIRRLLRSTLERNNYEIVEAADAKEAMQALADNPDIVLLDLGLPDRDGMELVPLIRKNSKATLLVVSARDATDQKVTALDLGADDYVTKPFDTEELLARMRAASRNRMSAGGAQLAVRIAELEIDLVNRRVHKGSTEIHLTPKEYGVLAELARFPGRVITHDQLLKSVWANEYERHVEYLRVVIRNLRQKIEDDVSRPAMVVNELGVGYRLMGADG